jgi:hypothetical protein
MLRCNASVRKGQRSRAPGPRVEEDVWVGRRSPIVLTSNTFGHVLEQRQRQVAMGMDAVLGG